MYMFPFAHFDHDVVAAGEGLLVFQYVKWVGPHWQASEEWDQELAVS
jgi:hypothetical protein